MKEYNYLGFYTRYSSEGTQQHEEYYHGDACFGAIFNRLQNDSKNVYEIWLVRGDQFAKDQQKSNICLLSKREVKNHIFLATKIYPFKYSVESTELEYNGKTYPAFKVKLDVEGVPGVFHRYLLTWVRYLYEFPYCFIMKDLQYFRKEAEARFVSNINLINMMMSVINNYINFHGFGIHTVISSDALYKFQSNKELKDRFKQPKVNYVNDIFKATKYRVQAQSKFGAKDAEFWTKEEYENVRKPKYLEALKKLKK